MMVNKKFFSCPPPKNKQITIFANMGCYLSTPSSTDSFACQTGISRKKSKRCDWRDWIIVMI